MRRARGARAFAWLVLASGAFIGCDPSDPCDPGYRVEHGACYKLPEPSGDGDGDGGSNDEDGGSEPDDAAIPVHPYEGFGDACEEQSDCPDYLVCGAPELALCTQVNCLEDEQICPPDWQCVDISAVSPNPDVRSVCLMP